LTVFIIERWIKKREGKRLLDAKKTVYAMLLMIIDRPLEAMSQLFPREYCQPNFNGYRYSFNTVPSRIEFDNLSTLRASIITYIDKYINDRLSTQVSTNYITTMRFNIYNETLLSPALDQIHPILAGSNSLIELELSEFLLQFELDCAYLRLLSDVTEKSPIPNSRTS
jgi:hypothetical protein